MTEQMTREQIEEIRRRVLVLREPEAYMGVEVFQSEMSAQRDRADLLNELDTQRAALRALVQQWREEAVTWRREVGSGIDSTATEQIDACADAIATLLGDTP